MMIKNNNDKRNSIGFYSTDDLVPQDHLVRKIEKAIDFEFIRNVVRDKYSVNGRPSIDPVVLIKICFIQYMFGIKSMRQTIKDITVNVAYRWFIGYDLTEIIPHFSTFGKNYKRRFEGTDLFSQIFDHIINQAKKNNLIDETIIYIDSTPMKANANKNKHREEFIEKRTNEYKKELQDEINTIRDDEKKANTSKRGRKTLKKDDSQLKRIKISTTDPEAGSYHKGEHEKCFAYSVTAITDKHGWILDTNVENGSFHDSQTGLKALDKIFKKTNKIEAVIADAGYKTPMICKKIFNEYNALPIMPYTEPRGRNFGFSKYRFFYDKASNSYLCPAGEILLYKGLNKDGYGIYNTSAKICGKCPFKEKCTNGKKKIITRHIMAEFIDITNQLRVNNKSYKELYKSRGETIERRFGEAKENHNLRFTRLKGLIKNQDRCLVIFACLNLKKLSNMINGEAFSNFKMQILYIFSISFA
jgi:transposase